MKRMTCLSHLPHSMAGRLILFLALVTITIVYYALRSIFNKYKRARRAKALGCQPPPRLLYKWPFAVDVLWRILKADRNKIVPHEFTKFYHETGDKATWLQTLPGETHIITTDPKNIQAMLATQFNDFEVGELRRAQFFALLGDGIFTSDGKRWCVNHLILCSD